MSELIGCAPSVCVVNAARGEDKILQFEKAAGGKGGVGFGDYDGRVLEACYESAVVDEVEGLREYPVVFGIINYEAAVWRYAVGC